MMKASKHEQELIDYINNKMSPLYAEYDKTYGVTIYPSAGKLDLDHSWDTFDNWLLIVSDGDTSMAEIFYYNFNEDRVQDVPEKMWERLYAKIEEFTKKNAEGKEADGQTELEINDEE